MILAIMVVRSTVWGQQPKKLCRHMSSEMSSECSRAFAKTSVVSENWYDNVKVQKYKQELNHSDL